MRNALLVVAGICLLYSPIAAADTVAAPSTPPVKDAPQAKPATPDAAATARKEIKVPEKAITPYVGEYELTPDRILTITLENGSLWGQPSGQDKRQLFAESPTKFFLKDVDIQLTFQKDAKGVVTGLLMDQAGRPQRELKKVK